MTANLSPRHLRTSVRRRPAGRVAAATAAALLLGSRAAPPAVAATAAASPAATAATQATTTGPRGKLLSVTPLRRWSRAEVAAFVSGNEVHADPATMRYGASTYRLTYATVTPQGEPTTASALFVLPDGGPHHLSTVSVTHGTTLYRGNAPSTGENVTLIGALLYAAGGRAVVAPDYLGLGTGPGPHPYVDTHSSVTASLDALVASRKAAVRHGRHLTRDVYATGFSQGGQVAMAVGRALQRGAEPYFRLRALAPISGPYDIAGAELPALFDGRIDDQSAVIYLAYFLTAQNRLHPLWDDPREVFREGYAGKLTELFDSDHTPQEILPQLPGTVRELLTDEWYEKVRHPSGTLAAVIRRNDGVCRWAPRVPVRLHTASGDRDVPIANARSCARDLAARGVHAAVIDHGDVDHGGAYRASLPGIARWFARLGTPRHA
ncbi:MAG TPA: alpha/beta hydrolase [Streptomyces sp.]|nr:alpha/beta hydrolase [Streptomyces sp.]